MWFTPSETVDYFSLHVFCRLTDSVYRFCSVNCFSLHPLQEQAYISVSSSDCKFSKISRSFNAYREIFVTLPSEAEEETGSAEEQPASNRLLCHTEIVTSGVVRYGYAHYFRRRPWLRKPIPAQVLRQVYPTDYASNVSARRSLHERLRAFCCRCSCEAARCCKTV